jgi:hypothetical protein
MTENSNPKHGEWLAFSLIFLSGVVIRVVQFLHCRSLWVDEASVGLNIVNRSYLALLCPLGYHQEAPVGFLWVSRFLVSLFGPNEYALRGYSLLCGIASLPVFYQAARRLYSAKVALLAMALLAFLPSMVRYSNEAKQFMGDVLWVGVLVVATQNASNGTDVRRWPILSIAGAVSLLFSYPAVFVVAGCGVYLILSAALRRGTGKTLVPLVLIGMTWLAFACVDYLLISPKLTADGDLVNYWNISHAPIPTSSWRNPQWYAWALWQFVETSMGFVRFPGVMIAAIAVGILAVIVRRKLQELMLFLPAVFALLTLSRSKYPFLGRWLLWLVPLVLLVICAGFDQLWRMAPRRLQRPALILAAAALLAYPVYAGLILTFRSPGKIEEIRDALQYLDAQESPAKVVYYNSDAESLLDFYFQSRTWTNLQRAERRVLHLSSTEALALPPDAQGKLWIVLTHTADSPAVSRLIGDISGRARDIQRWQGVGATALVVNAEAKPTRSVPTYPRYPLKLSGDGRYLVDQNNTPFLIIGDDAWSLITQLSNSNVEVYLSDRSSRGFSALWVGAADNTYQSNPPCNYYGDRPFDGADFTRENAAYWAHVDHVISRAAAYGMIVFLSPAFVGLDSNGGYSKSYQKSSNIVMTAYGTFLGNRYKGYPNIIWVLGGDADPAQSSIFSKLSALAEGIKSSDTVHLMTFEASRSTNGVPVVDGGYSSLDAWREPPSWLNLNWLYLTPTTIAKGAATNYSRSPWLPPFLGEDYYELEHSMTALQLRQEGYCAILSGAYLGRIFGNAAIWTFNSPKAQAGTAITWQSQLDSAGSVGQSLLGALFRSREHWKLVPDIHHTVMSAGYQSGSTLAATARTSDGNTVISYIPTQRVVTMDMTKISDAQAKAWWFDPRTGTSTLIGTFGTTGSQSFTPPDQNDWVLVIDRASLQLPPPGTQND